VEDAKQVFLSALLTDILNGFLAIAASLLELLQYDAICTSLVQ
jgi:hypothetical protein